MKSRSAKGLQIPTLMVPATVPAPTPAPAPRPRHPVTVETWIMAELSGNLRTNLDGQLELPWDSDTPDEAPSGSGRAD